MEKLLNPPENILANLNGAPERMQRVDCVLGEDLKQRFARGIAGILAHSDFHEGCLCRLLPDPELGADVAIQLHLAATEGETAWNTIRLANVPASFRQSRVALECVACAVMMSLPTSELLQLSPKLGLVKLLSENPGATVSQLYQPIFKQQGKLVQRVDPMLKGNAILPAFFATADKLLLIPPSVANSLQQYVGDVYHPASHSSMDIFAYHFEDFDASGKAGAMFSEERKETFRGAAINLVNLTSLLIDFLDRTYRYLENRQAKKGIEM